MPNILPVVENVPAGFRHAGLMPLSPLDALKVDEWERMVDVNIKGVLYGIAAALPKMQEQHDGQIINLSSVAGHVVPPSSAVYSGTKFAVWAISEGLRQEVGEEIRTTTISPGAMLTCGLFTSRSLYGQVGDAFGWRASYVVAAVLSAIIGTLTISVLPKEKGKEVETYAGLLRSLPTLLVEEPTLRKACLLQGTIFATFNMFWTTLVFTLTTSPYGFSTGTAGLFGLFGLLSAASAPFVGGLIDRRGPVLTLGACLLVTICSAVAFFLGGTLLPAIIVAIVLLGIGIQGGMSANQTRVLTIRPEAGSRMNTVFLVLIFVFGAAGGAAGSGLYHAGGWPVVCISALCVSTAGFIVWLILDYRSPR